MFDRLIKFSLTYRQFVLGVAAFLLIYGLHISRQLPVDVLPDLNRPTITIMTEASSLAPEEVESQITIPLERALAGVADLTRLRSISGIGLSIIFLEFDWKSDIYRQRQLISERLSTTPPLLPPGITPMMAPITSMMGEIMLIGISSDKADLTPMHLRTLAEWTIKPRLLTIPGIAQVTAIGGDVKQYQILLEPALMHAYKITLQEVENSLKTFGQNTTGGFLEENSKEWLIRPIGLTTELFGLRKNLIKMINGTPIAIENIAQVHIGAAVKRGDANIDGNPAVILAVMKQPSANTLDLTAAIDQNLKSIEKTLPTSLKIHNQIFRQADFINRSIANVSQALMDGFILITIILIVFLANGRTTLISLTAIPLSIIVTLIIFKWFNFSINTMTLGGLAIAIGELVDDAIVDVENIFRRLRENSALNTPLSTMKVVFNASREIRSSIIYATLIVILVFIPLMALGGIEGRLFTPLGIAYMVSIGSSLIVSLTITPALSYFLLPHSKAIIHQESWLVTHLKAIDTRMLTWSLDHPKKVILPFIAIFLMALASLPFLRKGFLPPFNEGTLTINIRLAPGSSLSESTKIGKATQKILKSVPEVVTIAQRTGRAEQDEHAEGVNSSDLEVILKDSSRSRREILSEIREKLLDIPGITINIGQPISHRLDHMLSGVRAEVVLKIFGEDLKVLRRKAQDILENLKSTPGLVDLQIEQQVNISQVQIKPDRFKSLLYGVSVPSLMNSLETLLKGREVAFLREGERAVPIVMRLTSSWRDNLDNLPKVPIESHYGQLPVEMVANIDKSFGPNMINRENQQRRLAVFANISGRDLNAVTQDIQTHLKNIDLPPGYFINLEGQYKSQQEANQWILLLGITSLFLILLILYSYFQSAALVFVIMLNIPMALIGSILALWISGIQLTVASLIGFITLTGIASRNGILKVTHYLHLMKYEGEEFTKGMIIRGSLERLTPVLMTALVAALALIPLLFNGEAPGKEILHPVALVIFGGLLSSTVLDTIITPVIFWQLGEKRIRKRL